MMQVQVNDHPEKQIEFKGETVLLNGNPVEIQLSRLNPHSLHALYQGRSYNVYVLNLNHEEKVVDLRINGKKARVQLTTEMDLMLKKMGLEGSASTKVANLKAPMPGLIHSVNVSAGDTVAKGDQILILEAMKMENVLKSPADGVIGQVHVAAGESVDKGELLISFA